MKELSVIEWAILMVVVLILAALLITSWGPLINVDLGRIIPDEMSYLACAVPAYVEGRYLSNEFNNLAVSNITSLSEIPQEEGVDDVRKRLRVASDICPSTGTPYTYLPVTPAGGVFVVSEHISIAITNVPDSGRDYFWLCEPPRRSRRRFLFTGGVQKVLRDYEVSWYYQCELSDLSEAELVREREYRKAQGLPPID